MKLFNRADAIRDRETYVYVEREIQATFIRKLETNPGPMALSLKAHRQMGKSSFLNWAKDELTEAGWKVAEASLRDARISNLDAKLFSNFVCRRLLESVDDGPRKEHWSELLKEDAVDDADAVKRIRDCVEFICDRVEKVLFFIDEFEAVSSLGGFAQGLFEATLFSMSLSRRVVWIYAGTQSPQSLIAAEGADPSKYPIFETLDLLDFDLNSASTIDSLAEGLSFEVPEPTRIVQAVLEETGGQPYLTNELLYRLEQLHRMGDKVNLRPLLSSEDFLSSSHFVYPEAQLKRDPLIGRYCVLAYKELISGTPTSKISYLTTSANKDAIRLALMQSGLVRENTAGTLEPRSPVYRRRFDMEWVDFFINELDAKIHSAIPLESQPEKRAKIAIINAGGTMGMDVIGGKVVQSPPGRSWFQKSQELGTIADFIELNVIEPTDGVNIGPKHWSAIATAIHKHQDSGYDGFIVIMGTDTMAYAASAVAFAIGPDLTLPVVFTGSQTPHTVLHGDARSNLLRSVQCIAHFGPKLSEVVICFNDEVYRAVRAEKKDDFRFEGFHSPSFPTLAVVGEVPKLTNIVGRIQTPSTSGKSKMREYDRRFLFYPSFEEKIFKLSLYPGLHAGSAIAAIEHGGFKGLVIESLGIGNVPTEGEYNILPVIEYCQSNEIPVMISSRYPVAPEFMEQYGPATEPLRFGAINAGNLTPAASLTKFMWVLARVAQEEEDNQVPAGLTRGEYIERLFRAVRVGELDEQAVKAL